MVRPRLSSPLSLGLILLVSVLAAPGMSSADYFSLYLKCEGTVSSSRGQTRAHVDLALRDNNYSALIQRSNILPVGEKMKYEESPALYSMTYHRPGPHTKVYYDWYRGHLFSWNPGFKRLAFIRMSIDRHTGKLAGDILNNDEDSLGRISMDCEPVSPEDLPRPKF